MKTNKHTIIKTVGHNSERSEAEGRAESRELGWKRRKWIKKKGTTTTTTTTTFFVPHHLPCKFEEKFHFLKKILSSAETSRKQGKFSPPQSTSEKSPICKLCSLQPKTYFRIFRCKPCKPCKPSLQTLQTKFENLVTLVYKLYMQIYL